LAKEPESSRGLGRLLGPPPAESREARARRRESRLMWPRVVEVMMGCWLAVSPFVFRHPPGQNALWVRDLLCAGFVITLALLSFGRGTRHAHLGILAVAIFLCGAAFLSPSNPPPPALQNDLVVGAILLMLAILPNEASLPPPSWRRAPPDR
jgi:hypothetical protein